MEEEEEKEEKQKEEERTRRWRRRRRKRRRKRGHGGGREGEEEKWWHQLNLAFGILVHLVSLGHPSGRWSKWLFSHSFLLSGFLCFDNKHSLKLFLDSLLRVT